MYRIHFLSKFLIDLSIQEQILNLNNQLPEEEQGDSPVTHSALSEMAQVNLSEIAIATIDDEIFMVDDNDEGKKGQVKNLGKIVGMGTLLPIYKPTKVNAFLHCIVVDKNHRREGIGTQIVDKLCKHATNELSVRTIRLDSPVNNIGTQKFCEKLGFELSTLGYTRSVK